MTEIPQLFQLDNRNSCYLNTSMGGEDPFLKTYDLQGQILDLAWDAIFFLDKKFANFDANISFLTGEKMPSLEGKHEVMIDFPADYISQTKKQMGEALKAFNRHLDHVSTSLLLLGFDTWNWWQKLPCITIVSCSSKFFVSIHV